MSTTNRKRKYPLLEDFEPKKVDSDHMNTGELLCLGLMWMVATVLFMYIMLMFCVAEIESAQQFKEGQTHEAY